MELPFQDYPDDNTNQPQEERLGRIFARILEGVEQEVGNERSQSHPWRRDRGGVVAAPSEWPRPLGTGVRSGPAYPSRPTVYDVSSRGVVNVWPNGTPAACCPILIVALLRPRYVVEGVSYSLRHIIDYCPNITRAVVYLSEYWEREVWAAHREAFGQIQRVGPDLRFVLQYRDAMEKDLRLPEGR